MSMQSAYRAANSPLHACRVSVAAAFTLAPAVVGVLFDNPIVLLGLLAAEVSVAVAAGVLVEFRRGARYAIALGLMIALINPVVSQNGLTVVLQGAELPVFGRTDFTLEAIVYGLVKGLRVVVTVLPFVLFSACVDPDQLLRSLRRASLRSALTVSLVTRMVPMLERDGRRLAQAYGLRADVRRAGKAGRLARLRRMATLTRALAAGSLERALDAAAVLEVRGYGTIRRPAKRKIPWSRHDFVFLFSAVALVGAGLAAWSAGLASFEAYPLLSSDAGGAELAFALMLPGLAMVPFGLSALARRRVYHRKPLHV